MSNSSRFATMRPPEVPELKARTSLLTTNIMKSGEYKTNRS